MHRTLRAVALPALIAVSLGGVAAAPASAKTTKKTFRKASGDYRMKLTTQRKSGSSKRYTKLRLTVGKQGVGGGLKNLRLRSPSNESWITRPYLFLADVNGDAIPDAIVDVYTGGAHCCQVSSIALSTGPSTWAKPIVQQWGGFYSLKDLDGNGVQEFVTADSRFDYAFTSHAGSALPVIVRAVQGGRLVDVTAAYPAELRSDADAWLTALADVLKDPADDPLTNRELHRSLLAAALADLLRLGALDEAKAQVSAAVARGDFTPGSKDDGWETTVGAALEDWGYVSDFRSLGLPE